ncbi:MAG: DNA glycosylase [Lachnospiraceae bacterium]|nr:DNA glycosylase [Lachnospiraceae bacterium]MDY5497860.1 DNA glycosylase [Anaerobutyricum sp.]
MKLKLQNFDIRQICESGQCFRMEKIKEDIFSIIAGERHLFIRQQGEEVEFFCEEDEFQKLWIDYFDLKSDYKIYLNEINPNDRYLMEAARSAGGVRILRQDLWEMIISFLISQQNNISRIRFCIQNICEKYGKKMTGKGEFEYYAFPTPEELSGASEEELRTCNLGYRSKYVKRAADDIASGKISLEKIKTMSYHRAKKELLTIYGVGDKIAECICLFALHHLQAFPVDTHIKQVMEQHYKRGFPNRRYKNSRGVMQQYIFYYELHKTVESNLS